MNSNVLGRVAFAGVLAGLGGAARARGSAPASDNVYEQTNLVSDVSGMANVTDTRLVGAWGITRSGTSPWWVNSTMGAASLVYDGAGAPYPASKPLMVVIPSGDSMPTGIVYNSSTDFALTPGNPARFIFVTLTGTISGWNPAVNPTTAVILVNNTGSASYSGAALAQRAGANVLYVADYGTGAVDAFDASFKPIAFPSGAFVDPEVGSDFAAFNVQLVGGSLYVAYAPKNVFAQGAEPGQGYVAIFDTDGKLQGTLKTGVWMNAPWGVVQASSGFGKFAGDILVGMFGNGQIAAFDPKGGTFRGLLRGTHGTPVSPAGEGLWGLEFGNGGTAGPPDTLYFATDFMVNGKFHGLFGTITAAPASTNGGGRGSGGP